MRVALTDWQPDSFALTNPGATDAKNVYVTGAGYAPIKALSAISTTGLSGKALGAISAYDSSGTTNSFAADATKLYKLISGVWTNISKGGGYSVSGTERVEFAQYGQRVISTQIGDVPQYYDLASSSVFANLAGSPPQARHIAVVRDFVVLGNTTANPQNITWSGFNDSNGWTAGTNQSDTQTLPDGGWVQAIFGGEFGTIFLERAIVRMTYIGPPLYFQFDTVETRRGLATPGAAIKVGSLIYFYAQDGFYLWDGSQSTSIGNLKVDNWFSTHLQSNTSSLITCGTDPGNKLVMWSFVSTDATDTSHPDTLLIYNWAIQEWSYAKIDHEMIYTALSEGLTLEQLGALYPIIENVPVSFDSRQWTGGTLYLGAFNTSHNLASFTGATLAGSITTQDVEPIPEKRSIVVNIRPITDTSAMTAICNSRERFADNVTPTAATAMQANGDIPLLSSGRFHQASLSIPAATVWTFANAVDIDVQDDGEL
jgi:hypothetical protein